MTAPGPSPTVVSQPLRKPRYEVQSATDTYTIRVELPGVPKDALSIDYDQGVLTIQGQCKAAAPENWKPLHRELNDLGYLLRLKLNAPVDEDELVAQLADGVLTLNLPIRDAAKPRRIEIN
ncbi:MAG: Hsp20/alpha crystallin family protein [Verrucomicrobiaceae bacterium]|jgi:HSP20 family protein